MFVVLWVHLENTSTTRGESATTTTVSVVWLVRQPNLCSLHTATTAIIHRYAFPALKLLNAKFDKPFCFRNRLQSIVTPTYLIVYLQGATVAEINVQNHLRSHVGH
ncbi:hypothetical protein Tcan_01170, partial [Toxocara canis]